MAAATPSRPSVCVIPSAEVLSLAEELQGLGGNDVALAEATSVSLDSDGAASAVANWINAGFNATLANLNGADALQMEQLTMFVMSLGSRLAATHRLAFTSATFGQFKAVDALGRPVSPIAGLKSAAAVEITSSTDLQQLLHPNLPQMGHVQDRIIALQAFSPAASTLSTFAALISSSPSSSDSTIASRQSPTVALLEEVAQLHAVGRPGEHILRSAQLSVFNQMAAPLVGGNVRVFLAVDEHTVGNASFQKMKSIKSVCSKVVLPASELRWVSMATWQSATAKQQELNNKKKKNKESTSAAAVAVNHQAVHPTQSTSSSASQHSVERRRQQRVQASASLQRAASRLAVKAAASGSGRAASPAPADSTASIDQSITSKRPLQSLRVEVPEGSAESEVESREKGETAETSAQPLVSAASVSESESGSRILDDDTFEAARRDIRESTRSLPVNRALSDLTSPSGAVQYGGSVTAHTISELSFGSGGGYSPHYSNAEAAASSAIRTTRDHDVFSFDQPPSSMAAQHESPAMQFAKSRAMHADDEICVDVSVQSVQDQEDQEDHHHSASPYPTTTDMGSGGHRGENAWTEEDSGDFYDNPREAEAQGDEQENYRQDYGAPRSLSFVSSMPEGTATLKKELEQERRVNAVLLRQLQDAEKRAAEATASAAVAESLARAHATHMDAGPITDPTDFKGMLGALHAARKQSTALKEDTLTAEEAKLSAEIELASMQRELNIARARCRALERQSSLAAAFAECEHSLTAAQQESAALRKENAELARKVADAEVDMLLSNNSTRNSKNIPRSDDATTSSIMGEMHRRLTTAHGLTQRLREELVGKEHTIQQMKQQVRSFEVNKRTAEDALRRNQQLREHLEWTESELRAQCLGAAEAAALAEDIEHSRVETERELVASRELCQQLDDVCDALRRQMDLLKGGGLHSRALRCLGDVNTTPGRPSAC